MSEESLAVGLLAQLSEALACFDAPHKETDQLAEISRTDPARFVRLFGKRMEALERRCCERDGVPVFSNLTGEIFCNVMITCPDIRAVLERSGKFARMFVGEAQSSRLDRVGDAYRFCMVERFSTRDDAALLNDLIGLHYHHSLLSWLSGKRLALVGVELPYARPAHSHRLLELFKAPVHFDRPRNALLFDKSVLALPVLRTASELEAALDCFPYNFMIDAIDEHGLPIQVKLLMEHALGQGRRIPSVSTIATILHMSETTLRRQLRLQGSSYDELRASSLRTAAERLLSDREATIASVAHRLSFSDDRAFRRAFKGWTGMAPSTFLSRNKVPPMD